ncbi:MAG: hypothetical protein M1824_001347 [Vezdaea acicularis]|nr:MAG: hypothetical protein M1824_001347 [Vezdaea acicularis]
MSSTSTFTFTTLPPHTIRVEGHTTSRTSYTPLRTQQQRQQQKDDSMDIGGVLDSIRHKLSRKSSNKPERKNSAESQTSKTSRKIKRTSPAANATPEVSPTTAAARPASPTRSMNPFTFVSSSTPRRPPIVLGTPSEPPPAYTPSPAPGSAIPAPTTSATSTTPPTPSTTADDRFAFLSHFDTHFLIDDSGSMAGSSWRATRLALEAITPICTHHDADGIDISFLNTPSRPLFQHIKRAATVSEIFDSVRPAGGTPTGTRLHQLLKPYLAAYAAAPDTTKPLNIIVITDGVPSDDVESVILAAARKLDKLDAPAWQVGVQFFQVGHEPGAAEALRELDDELGVASGLGEEVRDMVDTVPWSGERGDGLSAEGVLKVVLGAVNRRLDRRGRSGEIRRR